MKKVSDEKLQKNMRKRLKNERKEVERASNKRQKRIY